MDTKILEYMVAIAETKSVARAAERFYLSHQALYRHVKNVESDLGAPIFTRTHSGIQLTPAGVLFVNDAQTILHAEEELERELAAMRRRKKRSIRIIIDGHLQNRFLKRVHPRFQNSYPDFILEVTVGNAAQARRGLLDGTADMAVFDSTSPQAADLEYLAFSSMDLLLAFPQSYTGPTDVSGLKAAIESGMFIILFPVGTTARSMAEAELIAHQIYPTRILEGAVQSSISHIMDGKTCGILPDIFCSPEVRSRIRIGDPFYTAYNVIAYPPSATPTGAAQDLMQIIMEEFPR